MLLHCRYMLLPVPEGLLLCIRRCSLLVTACTPRSKAKQTSNMTGQEASRGCSECLPLPLQVLGSNLVLEDLQLPLALGLVQLSQPESLIQLQCLTAQGHNQVHLHQQHQECQVCLTATSVVCKHAAASCKRVKAELRIAWELLKLWCMVQRDPVVY